MRSYPINLLQIIHLRVVVSPRPPSQEKQWYIFPLNPHGHLELGVWGGLAELIQDLLNLSYCKRI
jgi:hypothetical protein